MSDAPERIWADPDHWIDHPPRRDADRPWEYAEYIRAEVDALVAENKRLRDALAHYATDENPDGWIAIAALTGENG